MELGGKSPAIIDESCDPDLVAKIVLFAKMVNLGQICISTDYLLCHESKLDAFMTAFKKEIENGYKGGKDGRDTQNNYATHDPLPPVVVAGILCG